MENPKVSIIVPVYNGEKDIEDCIGSILSQSFKDFELICIDDGSYDNTLTLLENIRDQDERLIVVRQDHGGVVKARCQGVNVACGEYVMFVDADDMIDKNMLENMVTEICDYDIITCGVKMQTKTCICNKLDSLESREYKTAYDMNYVYSNMIRYKGRDEEGILQYCFAKLYRESILRKIINELDHDIKYAEDRELVYRYMLEAKSIKIVHECYYFYRYRENSAVHGNNIRVMEDLTRLYLSLNNLFSKHTLRDVLLSQLNQMMTSRIYLISTFMGFSPEHQTVRYVMPYFENISNKRLVLYGAGVVGCNYYRQTLDNPDINWVSWIDKNPRIRDVSSVGELSTVQYDYIVVAVKNEELFEEIKRDLSNIGVNNNKILWKMPISLAE